MEKVTLELTWEEYTLLLGLIEQCKNKFDTQDVSELYVKLYTKRKVEKG